MKVSHDREAFLRLPGELYAEGRIAVKANESLEREVAGVERELFVAMDGDRVVARTAARLRSGIGMLGHFEAHDDPAATTAVLHAATAWLRERGAHEVIGPIDGDTWHRYRVNAGPHVVRPFLLEPVNPPYYAKLWRAAGAEIAESYVSQRIDDITPLMPSLASAVDRASQNGYRIRPIDPAALTEELTIVWKISREIFADNAYYFDITLEDFLALYAGIEQLLVPGLVLFAEAKDGTPVGFLFAYPDGDPAVVNYKTIGVLSAHRGSAVAAALQASGYRTAISRSARAANHCLIRTGNRSESMDRGIGYVFRNYYLYRMAT